ncbi:MAG: ubiA [Rickettsiaceae bacterium]|jgi:4-hydroxybenzoate polyprenyltransferase|nr:ubiA [Rickettsiaceae bacterium]
MNWIDNHKIAPLRPYFKIMRLDNLTGSFLLLWPCLWSISLASGKIFPWKELLVFIIGAFVMRSGGCIINDIVDYKLDAKVERTKNRPLSNGTLKIHEALLLLFLLMVIGGTLLFSLNNTAIILGFIVLVPIVVYPFMKRVTYWPQLFLAFTINWGALIGWVAIKEVISIETLLIYIACIFWTMGYDTIYAHQDKEDDMLLGIKSTALKFGQYSKKYLYIFYAITIGLLWLLGIMLGTGFFYYVFLFVGAFHLFLQVKMVDLNNQDDCMRKFSSNKYFGLIILVAILAGKLSF